MVKINYSKLPFIRTLWDPPIWSKYSRDRIRKSVGEQTESISRLLIKALWYSLLHFLFKMSAWKHSQEVVDIFQRISGLTALSV